jgi:hypothetical protein
MNLYRKEFLLERILYRNKFIIGMNLYRKEFLLERILYRNKILFERISK